MADTQAFELACEDLERETNLDRLESRGTIRIALKEAGLDSTGVAPRELSVVVERILPDHLAARGVEDVERVCRSLQTKLDGLAPGDAQLETPAAVFARLGGASA